MRRRIPSTTALLCFEAAARTENFARAAEDMNLTQSALSRQIQQLEAEVKQPLFIRARQRVKLTAAGRALVAELSPQLEALEASLLSIRSHDKDSGALNIGSYPTFGSRWLMPRIIALSQQQPGMMPNMITFLSNEALDPSLMDIAIAQGDMPWTGFRADPLLPETLVAVASPDLLAAPLEDPLALLQYRILQHTTRPASWQIWLRGQGLALPRPIIGPMFNQFEMLIDAVKGGHGLAILPRLLVERELEAGALILAHAHEETPTSAYFLLTPNAKIGTPRIERLRRWLLQSVGSDDIST